jgi:ABC-type phosphate/phosphonate transport system substrate-binding protein
MVSLASSSYADTGGAAKKRHFIMGGSALGLRGGSRQDTENIFNVNLTALSDLTGSDLLFTTVIYPDSKALVTAFDRGEIDGFWGTPLEYLYRKDQMCKIIAGVQFKYSSLKQSVLLIGRADNAAVQLKDLKNKRLTLAPYLDVEELYLNTVLLRNKLPEAPVFFKERKDAKNANVALMDVFFNNSDLTVVRENDFNTAVELNPQLAKKLVILDKSSPYLAMLGVISKSISEKDYEGFINSFNKIADTEKGRKLMDVVNVSRVVPVTPDDTSDLQALRMEYESLKQHHGELKKKTALPD